MILRYIKKAWEKFFYSTCLKFRNIFSHEKIVGDSPVAVSLTSYGKRVEKVFYTIESIGRGHIKPKRLILWIDDYNIFQNLPSSLRRLQARGLEVLLTEKNYGPHTKYYPYVKNCYDPDLALVTSDDDNFYPKYWLQKLVLAYGLDNSIINCYRAHVVTLNANKNDINDFRFWGMCDTTLPRFVNHATGVGGVIYPPLIQKALQLEGESFLDKCPKGDDIWLHVIAIRNGFKIKQINAVAMDFTAIPFTQDVGLKWMNTIGRENDKQAKLTYTKLDVEIMKAELSLE